MLATALEILRKVSTDTSVDAGFDAFEKAVAKGVSANLCSAVSSLGDVNRGHGVDIAFGWSRTRPVPEEIPRHVIIPEGAIPVIEEAARLFEEKVPFDDYEAYGPVVKLDSNEPSQSGIVTVISFVESGPRKIVIELKSSDYQRAIDAHKQSAPIRCTGVLTKEGRQYRLSYAHALSIDNSDDDK